MQQPYGPGLELIPDALGEKLTWAAKKVIRKADKTLLKPIDRLGLEKLRVTKLIAAKDRIGHEVHGYRVLHPAQSVSIAQPGDESFLALAKNYGSGTIPLAEAFVCEVSPAHYYPHLGLVANKDFEVFCDSVLLPHRFQLSPAYRSFKPRQTEHHIGVASTIQRIDSYSFWHWFADCLPQLLTIERYMEGQPLTLFITDDLGSFQRETLALVAPPSMTIQSVPGKTWIRADRFILPSYLSGRCNGYLHDAYYYDEIRRRIAHGFGLPKNPAKDLRIYLSRAGARRRRIKNERALVDLLSRYGFIEIQPEKLSLRDQVDMFQRAEVIAGPHGSGLGGIAFAPGAKVLVFYSEPHPSEYFYTMSRRVGAQHYGVIHNFSYDEDCVDDFPVDLDRIEATLAGPMGLEKK
ncbi:glycosyltransferase family 61 protein [Edaphobacter flagellatus]|uniref:glycosyltransferase family 61 protein n=1 Tax=Edaphobacter flagellatus TaxID=1933044 RepID=UPI0021B2EF2B|nr:glycosyltransferase family 61 protein [Edaphobacter flagellatus]